jgi:predicted DNA-binding transcriptional regulator YafY
MPLNKNAILRYRIIDKCLTNTHRRFPDTAFLLEKINEQLPSPISESMLNKDLRDMKDHYDAPIKFDRTRKGYYYTEEGFSIKEFPLTHEEIEALDYSTALLQQLKGTRMFDQFENAINKVIEGYRISKVIGKPETQIIQVEEPVKTGGTEWLEKILKAIVERSVLKLQYQAYGKPASTYDFSPYLLKQYRNRWYVVGYAHEKKNVLVFALDRITGITITKEKYKSDDSFSPDEFFKYSFGITQLHNAKPEKVVLAFNGAEAPYIISQPLHHSQKALTEEGSDPYVIELNVYLTAELRMTILSFGNDVEVLEPECLRKELEECVREMGKHYEAHPQSPSPALPESPSPALPEGKGVTAYSKPFLDKTS